MYRRNPTSRGQRQTERTWEVLPPGSALSRHSKRNWYGHSRHYYEDTRSAIVHSYYMYTIYSPRRRSFKFGTWTSQLCFKCLPFCKILTELRLAVWKKTTTKNRQIDGHMLTVSKWNETDILLKESVNYWPSVNSNSVCKTALFWWRSIPRNPKFRRMGFCESLILTIIQWHSAKGQSPLFSK